MELPSRLRPTNFSYKVSKLKKKVKVQSLGISNDYPYDWFLGGTDSCQVGVIINFLKLQSRELYHITECIPENFICIDYTLFRIIIRLCKEYYHFMCQTQKALSII